MSCLRSLHIYFQVTWTGNSWNINNKCALNHGVVISGFSWVLKSAQSSQLECSGCHGLCSGPPLNSPSQGKPCDIQCTPPCMWQQPASDNTNKLETSFLSLKTVWETVPADWLAPSMNPNPMQSKNLPAKNSSTRYNLGMRNTALEGAGWVRLKHSTVS